MSSVSLEFLENKLVYAPGDKICGLVKICYERDFKLNVLKARLRGKSHTGWYDAAKKAYVDAEEYYADHELILWSIDDSSNSYVLNAGTHNFPFEFQVPETAPCSFEGSLGWVRYSIYVIADFPDRFDKEKKVFVTVLPKVDLNLDPRARSSPHLELKEGVGFLSTKIVTINASLNKGGFVPGEPLSVMLDIENGSDKDISEIKVVLEEKTSFIGTVYGTSYRRVEKRAAGRAVEDFLIKSRSHRIWHGKLKVPCLPPSDLPGCSIIDLKYRLLFKLKCGTFSKISFKMPFIIGTIPVAEKIETESPPALVDEPPSYMECVFGTVDGIEDERREELINRSCYSPLYGYYNWPGS